jgi:hypothetical protein
MNRATLTTLVLATALAGCGDLDYQRWSYERPPASVVREGDNMAYLSIDSTRNEERTWRETRYRLEAPYTLRVGVVTKTDPGRPFEVLSLTLEHEGKTTVLHDRKDAPLAAKLATTAAGSDFRASVTVPLGDKLAYVEGSRLVVKAVVRPAFRDGELAFEQAFDATHVAEKGNRIDELMSQ